ncbi:RTA1 like protein-domain-containing protein [Phyllosticta citrichinensis]|uniref:RTA1 like protein-domain-containing protein n=1 Tax=Phyllosticta citrichinensis TaxID=1130410 RepID=A0ABR1XKR2_9PEZI
MAFNDGPPYGPVVNGSMVVVFWEYRPSESAGYAFMVLFAIAMIAHLGFLCWLRAWSFIPFILGGVCEVFGYYERAKAYAQVTVLDPWLLQNMLLLVGPPLLAASVYMSYGRLITAIHDDGVPKKRKRDRGCRARCCISCWSCSPTKLYVLIDIVAIFTQLLGTVLPASSTPEGRRLSKIIVLVGLFAQLVALAVFTITCGRMHARLRRSPTTNMCADPGVNWLGYFIVLEVATIMLVIRSIVRGIEFVGGTEGFVGSHEVFIYMFDGVPMLEIMVGFLVLHSIRVVREVRKRLRTLADVQMSLREGASPPSYSEGRSFEENRPGPEENRAADHARDRD